MKKNYFIKSFIVISIILLLVNNSYGKGGYINAGFGYNVSTAHMTIGSNSTNSNAEVVAGTLGKGLDFGVAFGYMFTDNISGEIGLSYLSGSEYKLTDENGSFTGTSKLSGSMMRIIPAIKITAGDKIKPYSKFGLIIGVGPKADATMESSSTFSGFTITNSETDKLSGGTSIGFMGALGADFNISEMICFYAEMKMIAQSWSPGTNDYSSTTTSNGSSNSESYTIKYVDSMSIPNDPSAHNQLKEYLPFSSFGLNVGLKFSLGK